MILNKNNCHREEVNPEKIWDLLIDFAKYGFNKSHSVSYSLISYSTAYAWVHYFKDFVEYNLNKHLKKRTAMMTVLQEKLGYKLCEFDYHKKYEVTDRYTIDEKTKTIYPPIPHEMGFKCFTEILRLKDKEAMQNIILLGVLDKVSYPDKVSADRHGLLEIFERDLFPNTYEDTDDWNEFINSLNGLSGWVTCKCIRDRNNDYEVVEWLEYNTEEENVFEKRDLITSDYTGYNIPTKQCRYIEKKSIPESSRYEIHVFKPRMRAERVYYLGDVDKEYNDKYDVKFKGTLEIEKNNLDSFLPDNIKILFEKWEEKLLPELFKRWQVLVDGGMYWKDADQAMRNYWYKGVMEQVPIDKMVNDHFSVPLRCEFVGLSQNSVTLKFSDISKKFYQVDKEIIGRFALKNKNELCHVLIHPKWWITQKGQTDKYIWMASYVIVGVV